MAAKKEVSAELAETTPTKMGALLPWRRGKRSGLFYRRARDRAAHLLMTRHGFTEKDAYESVAEITEREMDELADSSKVGDLGNGSLLQKIIDFITSENFIKFIEAIAKLILIFGEKKK